MKKVLILLTLLSTTAFAGQVERSEWPASGVTGFAFPQMGMVGPNEPIVSPIEACLLEAIRHSKELGTDSVGEVVCRASGTSAYYGKMTRKQVTSEQ